MNNKKVEPTQEFETTVLDINPERIKDKLKQLGASEQPERLLRRWVYDLHPTDPEWIRLRDNGDKITLTYKKRGNSSIGSTTEIEIIVDDFDKTAQILSKLPFHFTRYQENKRQIFKIGSIEFSIDSWPKIPPYLEIEAESKEKVQEGLKMLELTGKDQGDMDVPAIFALHNIDLNSFTEFKF